MATDPLDDLFESENTRYQCACGEVFQTEDAFEVHYRNHEGAGA